MTQPNDPKDTKLGGAPLQPNPTEVNDFHQYDDTDDSPTSHHHTLGKDQNQAAPGNHTHNGVDSQRIANTEFLVDFFVWAPGTSSVGPIYQAPTSLNGNWVPADVAGTDGPPSYRKDAVGVVRLRGIAKDSTTVSVPDGTQIAVLPAGYRPRDFHRFIGRSVDDFGAEGWWTGFIKRTGEIVFSTSMSKAGRGQISNICLDNITFLAEN